MVHLSIAHHLVKAYGYPSCPAFYLGSIAPDAIHMRAGTDRADKLAVHLVGRDGIDLDRVQALVQRDSVERDGVERDAVARDGIARDSVARDGPGDGLTTGYAAHVLTDGYWRETVLLPFRAQHEERLSRGEMAVSDLRTLYYDECDKIDLDLYGRAPWRPQVWELLRSARARDLDGLHAGAALTGAALAADEIERWRDRVLPWFETNRHKADYTPRYLTLDQVLAFVDDAAARVHAQLAFG
jgi:hypothetical protein